MKPAGSFYCIALPAFMLIGVYGLGTLFLEEIQHYLLTVFLV